MKIVYLHQYFNLPSMSGGTRSYEIAKHLAQEGHEVHIVTSFRGDTVDKRTYSQYVDDFTVHWLPIPYSNKLRFSARLFAFFHYAFRSLFFVFKLNPNIVFCSSTPLTVSIPALASLLFLRIPFVLEVRDLWPEMPIAMGVLTNPFLQKLALILEFLAYRFSTSIITLSPGMKSGILRTGIPSRKVSVIPNFSNPLFFTSDLNTTPIQPCVLTEYSPYILYAGTFGFVNNLSYAVLLSHQLSLIRSNVKVVLVGDGIQYDTIHSLAKHLNVLNRNLFIYPRVSKEDIVSFFHFSSMSANFVADIPEAWNNSANKFFDTLAASKPVLINSPGWLHDLVVDYSCGYSAYGLPLDQVAKDLNNLLNSTKWVESRSSNSNFLSNHFTRDISVELVHRVLKASSSNFEHLDVSSYSVSLFL